MTIKTYTAEILEPTFYSSREGKSIETNERISATALMHAIGYSYGDLDKRYIEFDEESTTPDYSHLNQLSFFVSDLEPVDVQNDEFTFRTTNYPEHSIQTNDGDLSKQAFDTSQGYPRKYGRSSSGWNRMRRYTGIKPRSTYTFTVWDSDDVLPETLRFRVGIKKSGFVKAEQTNKEETVTLNKYLLSQLFGIDDTQHRDLAVESRRFVRDNDPRLHHYVDVDIDKATNIVDG